MSFLLGLDVGTTGCKAVIFDFEGNIKGYGFQEYEILYPGAQWAEQDASSVWETVKKVLKMAIYEAGIEEIKAIGVSVQGDAIIPVDKNITPLRPAILGMDYRSLEEARECADLFGDRKLFEMTGMRPHPINSLTKILWVKKNEKDIYSKTYKFMTYGDFILTKLGADLADPVIDSTMASRTMAFDIQKREWSREILEKVDVDIDLLSRPVPSGRMLGKIHPDLYRELGISKETAVVTGGHDQVCAAIGSGCIEEGIGLDSHGTAEVLSTTLKGPLLNSIMFESFYPCYLHGVDDAYFTFALLHIGGILFKWYRDNFAYAEVVEAKLQGEDPYDIITRRLKEEPSSVFVLPHFNGSGTPWCDLESKGAILGLNMSTTRNDIAKAIMDSLTYELRINIERMKEAGIKIREIRTVGGGAKSPLWLKIKANILGFPIHTLKVREAACLGAAILAGKGTGEFSTVEHGVDASVRIDKEYLPDDKLQGRYEDRYKIYKSIYEILKPLNHMI